VTARRAFRKDRDVTRRELSLANRPPEGGTARDSDQPLLTADLVVIGPGLLARRQLVEAAAEKCRTEALADRRRSVSISRPIVLAVPVLFAKELETSTSAILRVPAWPSWPA
jgi:hypothetical protein